MILVRVSKVHVMREGGKEEGRRWDGAATSQLEESAVILAEDGRHEGFSGFSLDV